MLLYVLFSRWGGGQCDWSREICVSQILITRPIHYLLIKDREGEMWHWPHFVPHSPHSNFLILFQLNSYICMTLQTWLTGVLSCHQTLNSFLDVHKQVCLYWPARKSNQSNWSFPTEDLVKGYLEMLQNAYRLLKISCSECKQLDQV